MERTLLVILLIGRYLRNLVARKNNNSASLWHSEYTAGKISALFLYLSTVLSNRIPFLQSCGYRLSRYLNEYSIICILSYSMPNQTSSSGDEIANVNFLYDDITNTIDSCMKSAVDRRGYVLERMFTKFSEPTQCNGHYAVKITDFGTNRQLIYDFLSVDVKNFLKIKKGYKHKNVTRIKTFTKRWIKTLAMISR